MRVLLDTDVVLDYVLEREPFVHAASELLELIAQGACDGYVSGVTPVNVFHLGRKLKGAAETRRVIGELFALVRVCPIGDRVVRAALALSFADYEDAVQHECAAAAGMDAIVTRNLGDYKNARLPVYSPTDLINLLKSQPK